jgi:hypothetical protein
MRRIIMYIDTVSSRALGTLGCPRLFRGNDKRARSVQAHATKNPERSQPMSERNGHSAMTSVRLRRLQEPSVKRLRH